MGFNRRGLESKSHLSGKVSSAKCWFVTSRSTDAPHWLCPFLASFAHRFGFLCLRSSTQQFGRNPNRSRKKKKCNVQWNLLTNLDGPCVSRYDFKCASTASRNCAGSIVLRAVRSINFNTSAISKFPDFSIFVFFEDMLGPTCKHWPERTPF